MTVREAGKDKQPNRQLVYGGGSLAAFALDVELRKRSADRVGLPDLLRKMRVEFGTTGKTYEVSDIVRIANALTGSDFAPFMAQAVDSTGDFDIRPTFSGVGLRMDSFVEEMYVSRDGAATQAQLNRFDAIFAPRPGAM